MSKRRERCERQRVAANWRWAVLVAAGCAWGCGKNEATAPAKAPASTPDAGAAKPAPNAIKPTAPAKDTKRTARLKYNVKYPDAHLEKGHSQIVNIAIEILAQLGLEEGLGRTYAYDIIGAPITGQDLVQYGAAWADYQWLGRPEQPDGVVWNPGANHAIPNSTDPNGRLWSVIYHTKNPTTGGYTFASDSHPSTDDENFNGWLGIKEYIRGAFWVGGPLPDRPMMMPEEMNSSIAEGSSRFDMNHPNVYSQVRFTVKAWPVFGSLLSFAEAVTNISKNYPRDYATDNLYHYSHADVGAMATAMQQLPGNHQLPDTVVGNVVLYPLNGSDIGDVLGSSFAHDTVASNVRGQQIVLGATYGAATYGAILYQLARKFFVGSPGAPTLNDLVPVGNPETLPEGRMQGKTPRYRTGMMKGVPEFEALNLVLPSTYLGGMPFICSGGSDVNDPCKDGSKIWPIWVPARYDDANLDSFLAELTNPYPARSDVAAFIYLGWALHLISDLSLGHHAANWGSFEHDRQDKCGDLLATWRSPTKVQEFIGAVKNQATQLLGASRAEICTSAWGLDDAGVPATGLNWEPVRNAFLNTGAIALQNLVEYAGDLGTGGCRPGDGLCVVTGETDFPPLCSSYVSNAVLSTVRLLYCALPDVVPDPPTGVIGSAVSHGAEITWSSPPRAGVTYKVREALPDGGWRDVVCGEANPAPNRCVINDLINDVTYGFGVQAENGVGTSPAVTVWVTPRALEIPAPTGVVATPSDGSITVTWDAESFMGLISYNVYIAEETSNRWQFGEYTHVEWRGGDWPVFASLENGRRYQVRVAIVWMGQDQGPLSDPVYATPLPAYPDPPFLMTATPKEGAVELLWQDGNRALAHVIFRVDPDGTTTPVGGIADDPEAWYSTAVVDGLTNGETYGFYVVAWNQAGLSTPSNLVTAVPHRKPGAPYLTANSSNSGEIALNWTEAPFADSYTVYVHSEESGWNDVATVAGSFRGYLVPDLVDGQLYYFRIVPSNDLGTGEGSNLVGPLSPGSVTVPPNPTGLIAVGGDRQATLSWNAVDSAKGYSVLIGIGTGTGADGPFMEVERTTDTSFVMHGLQNGTTFYFVVASIGANGALTSPYGPAVAVTPSSCHCVGVDHNSAAITAACGETVCGAGGRLYSCSSSGWAEAGGSCGGCQCNGSNQDGASISVPCGSNYCGPGNELYSCHYGNSFALGMPCQCHRVSQNGELITAAFGQSACASGEPSYSCSGTGWTATGETCPACQCQGTGANGNAITASCGQSACGVDSTMYACTSQGWSATGEWCPPCQCVGVDEVGNAITAICGVSICGQHNLMYTCGSAGWSWTGEACPSCRCSGQGPNGQPVSAACGQEACGIGGRMYTCVGDGWTDAGRLCPR